MQIRNLIIHIAKIYTMGEWMVTFSFLVQLNTNGVSVLSILLAVIMVDYAVGILLTADSSELLWGYPKSCPHSSLLLRSL